MLARFGQTFPSHTVRWGSYPFGVKLFQSARFLTVDRRESVQMAGHGGRSAVGRASTRGPVVRSGGG